MISLLSLFPSDQYWNNSEINNQITWSYKNAKIKLAPSSDKRHIWLEFKQKGGWKYFLTQSNYLFYLDTSPFLKVTISLLFCILIFCHMIHTVSIEKALSFVIPHSAKIRLPYKHRILHTKFMKLAPLKSETIVGKLTIIAIIPLLGFTFVMADTFCSAEHGLGLWNDRNNE